MGENKNLIKNKASQDINRDGGGPASSQNEQVICFKVA